MATDPSAGRGFLDWEKIVRAGAPRNAVRMQLLDRGAVHGCMRFAPAKLWPLASLA